MAPIDALVVPYDGSVVSARALPVARDLAERTGAEVILVTSILGGGGALPDQLDDAVARLSGVAVCRVETEDLGPAAAVLAQARASHGRLVVMSTHGRGGLRRAVLGSVAREVIRAGDVPVLVVGPGYDPVSAVGSTRPIQLRIDGSDRSSAVAAADDWAGRLAADVQVQTAVNPGGSVTTRDLRHARCPVLVVPPLGDRIAQCSP